MFDIHEIQGIPIYIYPVEESNSSLSNTQTGIRFESETEMQLQLKSILPNNKFEWVSCEKDGFIILVDMPPHCDGESDIEQLLQLPGGWDWDYAIITARRSHFVALDESWLTYSLGAGSDGTHRFLKIYKRFDNKRD